ncbi:response regulator [Paraglaciecola aquimarina]|uniref:Response regulator n=1 Tax=Paraglaciecola aquimarina TaxID=1235557 RepID=A0ABU3SSS7_9ALTE|nr:response regulator [Paraglaciecola aquimarina]MDU0353074.1 response regulator [Paraglaciecola aquimarina]
MVENINILLVDDVEYSREILRSAIISCIDDNKFPIRPHFFQTGDGTSVIEIVQHRNIHLIYLDINLAAITSGLDVLEGVRKIYKDLEVVMCSSESSSDNVMAAIKNGANGFIVKPFNSGRVSDTLKKYLLKNKLISD